MIESIVTKLSPVLLAKTDTGFAPEISTEALKEFRLYHHHLLTHASIKGALIYATIIAVIEHTVFNKSFPGEEAAVPFVKMVKWFVAAGRMNSLNTQDMYTSVCLIALSQISEASECDGTVSQDSLVELTKAIKVNVQSAARHNIAVNILKAERDYGWAFSEYIKKTCCCVDDFEDLDTYTKGSIRVLTNAEIAKYYKIFRELTE